MRVQNVVSWLAAFATLFAVTATPAAALDDTSMVAAFTGTGEFGKYFVGSCTNDDQTGSPTGPGFGLPLVNGDKSGWWKLVTNFTAVPQAPLGWNAMTLCGKLSPAGSLKKTGIGAACGASSGHDGFGTLIAGVWVKKLRNLGWTISVGDVLPWTARVADPDTKKAEGHLGGLVYATGGMPCLTKVGADGSKSGGAQEVSMFGVFAVAN